VLLQRLAQIDRLHAVPLTLKPAWDEKFLDVLYAVITTKKVRPPLLACCSFCGLCSNKILSSVFRLQEENFGEEVFVRVERTFCSGLQSSDPDTRQKFFKLYSDRIPRDLFERLRFIIQVQDWDFLSHTFWLKHAVVSSSSFLTVLALTYQPCFIVLAHASV